MALRASLGGLQPRSLSRSGGSAMSDPAFSHSGHLAK